MAKKTVKVPQWIQDSYENLKKEPLKWLYVWFGDHIEMKDRYLWYNRHLDPVSACIFDASKREDLYGNRIIRCQARVTASVLAASIDQNMCELQFGWYEKPYVYGCTLHMEMEACHLSSAIATYSRADAYTVRKCTLSEIAKMDKLTENAKWFNILNEDFDNDFPYAVGIQRTTDMPKEAFYFAPHLEQLYKAGYVGLYEEVQGAIIHGRKAEIDMFNRLTKPGTDIKSIFKTEKPVYKGLKEENAPLKMWDICRKMVKGGKINADAVTVFAQMNMQDRDCQHFYNILSRTYNGSPVFSFTTLVNYLGRLDMYEAIDMPQALELLEDYLRSCEYLRIKPNIESDSLMREHNIAARLCRETRQERFRVSLDNACKDLQRWNYSENQYMIRGIESYDDLMDEAKQQRNCVACYANDIAKGARKIYVMRRTACPEKSLITVEVTPDGRSIRQKYLARNMPIRNTSQQEFLQRWLRYISTISAA